MLSKIKERIARILKKGNYLFYFGNFKSWEDATKESAKYGDSYQGSEILSRVAEATDKVRRGEALYEQDGVAYYEENNNYELIAAFLYVYTKQKKLHVIDFGGSLGSTYFRYRELLSSCNPKWEVVEQSHYVEYGKKHISEIKYKYSISECDQDADVVLLSSVLAYLDNPYMMFKEIMDKGIPYIIIDETAFSQNDKELITLQHVPKSYYKAIYPLHIFSYSNFVKLIAESGYEIMWEWEYKFGSIPIKKGMKFIDTLEKGFLLKKSE